jgi:hypothetical protein
MLLRLLIFCTAAAHARPTTLALTRRGAPVDAALDAPRGPRAATSRALALRGGLFAGLNPLGYKMTALGEQFLEFDGSRDSDLGRLLSSLKSRKRHATIKSEWLELMRFSKTGQALRIYKELDAFLAFLLKCGFIA